MIAAAVLANCRPANTQSESPADRTAKYLESTRNNTVALLDFLERMPKGGDLHHHLTGAVYAESYIDYAVEDGLCIDQVACDIVRATLRRRPPGACRPRRRSRDFPLRNHVIDSWSIRNFVPAPDDRDVRHHFFAAFGKFDPVAEQALG